MAKGKVVLLHAYRKNGGTVPLIFHLAKSTSCPTCFTTHTKNVWHSTERKDGWVTQLVWTFWREGEKETLACATVKPWFVQPYHLKNGGDALL